MSCSPTSAETAAVASGIAVPERSSCTAYVVPVLAPMSLNGAVIVWLPVHCGATGSCKTARKGRHSCSKALPFFFETLSFQQ